MDAKSPLALELFYCYARADKADRDELEQHLAGLKRKYRITGWSDQEILPGKEWEKAIEEHLKTADVILLLVSARFMDSDYCYSVEMQRALARHEERTALVIPILLHPVYLEDAPFEKLQMLPTDAKPISKWANRDEAFWDVTTGIARAVAELLKSWPSKEEWLKKGMTFLNLNRFEEALAAYEQALRLDPSSAIVWNNKGYALYLLNRFEEALAAYEHALHLDPSSAIVWNNKGSVFRKLNRFEEALAAYEHALRFDLDLSYPFFWDGKGSALLNLRRFEEALLAFEQTLRLDPSFIFSWNGKGYALYLLKRDEEALLAFEQALRLDPSYSFAWNGKGNTLYNLNRFAEALVAYEQALRLDPNNEIYKQSKELTLKNLGRKG